MAPYHASSESSALLVLIGRPARPEIDGPFLTDRKGYLDTVVRPLQDKEETVYVVPGSDAEVHVAWRFPKKRAKRVGNGLNRLRSVRRFLRGLPLMFQHNRSKGMDATYHFTFTGAEAQRATVVIRDQKLEVAEGHAGKADLHVTADSRTRLAFLAKEQSLVWALLRRKIRIQGPPKLLLDFGRCFPS